MENRREKKSRKNDLFIKFDYADILREIKAYLFFVVNRKISKY